MREDEPQKVKAEKQREGNFGAKEDDTLVRRRNQNREA